MDVNYILAAIIIGVGATLVTDVWTLLLKRAFNISSLNYCLLGRWFLHMPFGTFMHASIHSAEPRSFECVVGWIAHYVIGVVFALVFLFLVSIEWFYQPALLPAMIFGIGTVVIPFFIMQPALGFGIAASKTPHPMQSRIKSLTTHAAFGLGLYLCASALNIYIRL